MKWNLLLLAIVILKVIYKFKPKELILNLLPVSLEQMNSGLREFIMNQNDCWCYFR